MTIWTKSKGIIKRKTLIEHCLKQKLSLFTNRAAVSPNRAVTQLRGQVFHFAF